MVYQVDESSISTPSPRRKASTRRRSETSTQLGYHAADDDDAYSNSLDSSIAMRRSQTIIACNPLVEEVNCIWNPLGGETSSASGNESTTPNSTPKSTPPRRWGMAGAYDPSWKGGSTDSDDRRITIDKRISSELSRKTNETIHASPERTPSKQEKSPSKTDDATESKGSSQAAGADPEKQGSVTKEKDTANEQKKLCNSIGFLFCTLLLVAGGVVVYFLTRPEEPTLAPATLFPTSSPSTSMPTTQSPTATPTTAFPSSAPTQLFFFDSPSLQDCNRVRAGQDVARQDLLTERNFDVSLDLIMDIRASQNTAMTALQPAIPEMFMPKLVGCDELANRKLRQHQRMLSDIPNRYIVGNGKIQWKLASFEKTSDCLMCFSARFHMDVYLKSSEAQDMVVVNLVEDLFGQNFVDLLDLERSFFTSVAVGSVIRRDATRAPSTMPSSSPSESPSYKPSTAPSFRPTMIPSARPSRAPTKLPSVSPTLSNAPTGSPTLSANPTATPSRAPTPVPSQLPTRAPTTRPTTGAPSSTPTAANQLVLLGGNKSPSSVYPLRECAGDCDNDDDCASGLFCFERNALENVPGCIGAGQAMMDYCYNPGRGFERLAFYGNIEYDYYELGQCEGDCDFDSDCEFGLICYEREGNDSGNVPSCVGNANTVGFGNDDYCIPRPSSNTLMSVFENEDGANVAGGGVYPIPRCAGDCDSDADCQSGLTCFQRAGLGAVPGCSGTGEEDFDYCV